MILKSLTSRGRSPPSPWWRGGAVRAVRAVPGHRDPPAAAPHGGHTPLQTRRGGSVTIDRYSGLCSPVMISSGIPITPIHHRYLYMNSNGQNTGSYTQYYSINTCLSVHVPTPIFYINLQIM